MADRSEGDGEPLEVLDPPPPPGSRAAHTKAGRPRPRAWLLVALPLVFVGAGVLVVVTASRLGNEQGNRRAEARTAPASLPPGPSRPTAAGATTPASLPRARPGVGTIVFSRGGPDGGLHVLSATGTLQRITDDPGDDAAAWSPTSGQIAFVRYTSGDANIYVIRPDGTGLTRLTRDGSSFSPSWAPDGSRILFLRERPGRTGFYTMRADGTRVRKLEGGRRFDTSPAWSPDGRRIAFVGAGLQNLYICRSDGSGLRAVDRDLNAGWPSWSPDGSKIAFANETDGSIDVINPDGDGWRAVVDLTKLPGGTAMQPNFTKPAWAPDGTSLVFAAGNSVESHLYLAPLDGSRIEQVTVGAVTDESPSWSQPHQR